jgi:hypothetical protein
MGGPRWDGPGTVDGVISADVARVIVQLDDGTAEALILESNDPDCRFFFLIYAPRAWWKELVAFDHDGRELERFTRPDD